MALLHHAELRPSKLELLNAWAPSQPWFAGDPDAELSLVASFRFDDPEGEVGVETLLVRAGDGPVLQIPLTYRGAPLEGAEEYLVGAMQHSVLGSRWAYDGIGDPVYRGTVATVAFTGGRQAEQFFEVEGVREFREPTALVEGSGAAGTPVPDEVEITVVRVPASPVGGGAGAWDASCATLIGTWSGQPEPVTLVTVCPRSDDS